MKDQLIIWDFDGVILLSDEVRKKGFEIIFKDYGRGNIDKLLLFHEQNGGLSRYVKIRFFYEEILGEQLSNEDLMRLANEFSFVMKNELTNKKLLNQEWLDLMSSINENCEHHIASGSDQEELKFLCKQLGISHYFQTINGSPETKENLVRNILLDSKDKLIKKNTPVLVGDAINDYDAATVNDIQFFGYRNRELKDKGIYLESLLSLKKHLDC